MVRLPFHPADLVLTLAAATAAVAAPAPRTDLPPDVAGAADAITARRALAHAKLLAHPELGGRDPGEPGFALASAYVRAQFEAYGLKGAGESGGFAQPFRWSLPRLGAATRLAIERRHASGTSTLRFELGRDFVPFAFSASAEATLPVAFAGYGIRAPEHGWDDYSGIDVRGRAVLVLRHEPRERDPKSPFDGRRSTRHATFLAKARAAQAAGAAALLVVTDPLHHDEPRPTNSLANWPELNQAEYAREGRPVPDGRPVLEGWYDDIRIPAVHVGAAVAEALLAGSGQTLRGLQEALDSALAPRSFLIRELSVAVNVAFDRRWVETENLLARIEGRDPALAGEMVLVGAHLDHVGKSWRGEVRPGADDNASGSSAVLEIADAFSRLETRPRRSVVFALWSGEEKGLLGSTWFVRHPTLPLDRIVGTFNLDMVGRNQAGVLSLVGRRQAPALHAWTLAANERVGLTLRYDAGAGAARSDNFPFLTRSIPSLGLFSGTHEDYHAPGDTADKLVASKLEAAARLGFLAAWLTAEDPDLRARHAGGAEASAPGATAPAAGAARPKEEPQ